MYIYSVDRVCKFIQSTKLLINLMSVVLFSIHVLERTFWGTKSRFFYEKDFFPICLGHILKIYDCLYAINEAYKLHKTLYFMKTQ